ncbi:uncharacterized protein LOC132201665 isoform X2 [Neocloeon triangulifer]|uniref:uncharacterized protein LOC132201665 isoform X2 n=1 Tax=Neocloeon triangulifer TaxID=2078957 RepID=UPI00286F0F90|nr:uncharacterized protein LOC132201665 isoform X2 [Neocloeon triangulifer]
MAEGIFFRTINDDSDSDNDDDSVVTLRRMTRSALSDVSSRIALPVTPVINLASLPTPSPSPDELVIQRPRRIPVTWSPDIKRTPIKLPPSSPTTKANGVVLRSTPRKRLLLPDDSPEKAERSPRKPTTPPKRKAPERLGSQIPQTAPLSSLLKGLSKEQLVELLLKSTQAHPEIEQDVRESLPLPDLKPVEEQLNTLKRNIFRCLPTSRLILKYDSPAFNRASTHVNVFKKAVIDFGRQLVESENYGSVIEYVTMAWGYVKATPTWENAIHNTARRTCFKTLAAYCMTAIKSGCFTPNEYQRIAEKLELLVGDSDDIQSCLKQVTVIRTKQPSTPTK